MQVLARPQASPGAVTPQLPLGAAAGPKVLAAVGQQLLYLETEYVAAGYPPAHARHREAAAAARAARTATREAAAAAQTATEARAARGWLGGGGVWLAALVALVAVLAWVKMNML